MMQSCPSASNHPHLSPKVLLVCPLMLRQSITVFLLKTSLKMAFYFKIFYTSQLDKLVSQACVVHSAFVYASEIPDMIDFPAPNPVLNLSLFIPACHNGRWWMYEFNTVTIIL